MKKKLIIGVLSIITIILAVLMFVWIYYFVLTDTIVLDGMPSTDIEEQIEIYKEMDFCRGGYLNNLVRNPISFS